MKRLFPLLAALAMIMACSDDDGMINMPDPPDDPCAPYKTCLEFGPGEELEILTALLTIEDSTKIKLLPGTYSFENLSIVNSEFIMLTGSGSDMTILDFSSQTSGGEGIRVTNVDRIIIRDMTVMDSKGDLIKLTNSDDIELNNVSAIWNSEADSTNGGYGFYPVLCSNILIDSCYVQGASDAGIYVGQSDMAVVRNSVAYKNVAGCEIENTTNADVYDNEFYNNTGGLLIFDLPGLSKRGGNVRAFNNFIHDNNFVNFAPSSSFGTTTGVGNTPPGSGILHVAMSDVEIFNNVIKDNNLSSIDVVSGFILDPNAADFIGPNYSPFPTNVYIHDNDMSKQPDFPPAAMEHELGQILIAAHTILNALDAQNHPSMQHILIDGMNTSRFAGGNEVNPDNLCIDEDEANLFCNLRFDLVNMIDFDNPDPEDVINWLTMVSTDVTPFTNCP